jgi:tRNA(fMet)-specific endonuclease VapC
MSLYVVDTDILTLYEYGHQTVCQRVAAHQPSELAITVISVEEQIVGRFAQLRRARQPDQIAQAYRELATTVSFLGGLQILMFPETAVRRYEQLKSSRLKVGKKDLRIAAIALESGGIVVTRNVRDFQRVPGLTIENWAV